MRPSDQLAEFVGQALSSGKSREDIAEALGNAGWSDGETRDALAAWSEADFTPPVPRPRAYVSAKEAFAYGLFFVSLGMIVWHTAALGFELIDLWIEDPYADWNRFDEEMLRWSIASLIVFVPLFLFLNLKVLAKAHQDPAHRRSAVRKWFGYITLFLSALALAIDLIIAISAFIGGDLTANFLSKTLLVAVLAAFVLLYYRHEMEDAKNA